MGYPPKFSDQEFLKLYQSGITDREMAMRFGVTQDAVSKRRRRKFKLPPNRKYKPWTQKEEQVIVKMRKKGFSISVIAKQLKRGRDAVWVRWKKLGRPQEDIKLNLSERQLGWLEGLIDGEGCLSISKLKSYKQTWTLTVHISNTNRQIIEKIKKVIGYGTITTNISKNKSHKPVWVYYLPRKVIKPLLSRLHLIVKEKQRELILEAAKLLDYKRGKGHCKDIDRKLEKICKKIRILNRRGKNQSAVPFSDFGQTDERRPPLRPRKVLRSQGRQDTQRDRQKQTLLHGTR